MSDNVIKAVIFDHSTLCVEDETLLAKIGKLLAELRERDLKIVVFSTHEMDINAELEKRGLPGVDLFLTRLDVGAAKGSPEWVIKAAQLLGINKSQFLYIGDGMWDWLTAINTPIVYLHAGWVAGPDPKKIVARSPGSIRKFADQFLLVPPRWSYTLDVPDCGLHLRCLLPSSPDLPCDPDSFGNQVFGLKTVFTYRKDVKVGGWTAQSVLILHALTSLSLEGLVDKAGYYFTIYPSSTPGKVNPMLEDFMENVAKLFHGYYKSDIMIRAVQAKDTSLERYNGRHENATLAQQSNTVHLNLEYKKKIQKHTVVVFDDFTTDGNSLEWARNLLLSGGAERVILITMGKYGKYHTIYSPKNKDVISPYELREYDISKQFNQKSERMNYYPDVEVIMAQLLEDWK